MRTSMIWRRVNSPGSAAAFGVWVLWVVCAAWTMGAEGTAPPAPAPAPGSAPAGAAPAPAAQPAPPPPAAPAPSQPAPVAKPAATPSPAPKPAEAKAEPKSPAAKAPEAKPTEPKPAEPKPAEAKPAPAKPPEPKPAETKPPEPKPAEAKPPEAAKAGPSYTQLARPAVADRLKLSDEQRAKVASLLAERREALAKATEADRAKVLEENEKKLTEVLSDAQRADFAKIPPEPLLRFNFRFQRWVDVLEEVARQAGLSLVLDAPPPGTLNYSDDKDYTPTEAIDLLNSVLLTKGFTLIRRDRMLVCVSTEAGIPENLVPRVTLDELDYRGKFELVTVMIPLEGRAAAAVSEEIKPLLSPLGKVVPLPATSQLLITDSAGNLRSIRTLVKAMPAAAAATAVAQPAKAEPPVFAIYPIKQVDPASVLAVMKTLYPAPPNNFVLDPKTDQLSVHAGASVQASVKAILEEMMKTGLPPEKQSRLELYAIDEARGTEILKSLEGIAPQAKLTLDSRTGRLVAWATGVEHDQLKKALEKLGMGPVPEQARQFEVYRLTKASPKSVLALLETLLPTARLAIDVPTDSLVVIGTASDQKAVKSILEQLQPEKPGPETPELRFYQLTRTPTPGMAKVIEGLAPKAHVTIDPTNKRLMVVAPAVEHTAVKNAVEAFEKGSAEEKSKLITYPVTQAQRTRFQVVLKTLTEELPGIQVITDAEPGELAIWAKPEQHKVLAEILEQLKRDVPSAEKIENTPQVETYRLSRVDPTTLVPLLQALVPEAKVSVDTTTRTLIVVAIPADQQTIRGVVQQFQPEKPGRDTPELRTYPITSADPTSVTTMLKSTFPTLQVTLDPKANRLLIYATASEHEALKKTLEQMQAQVPPEQQPRFEVYPVYGAEPATLVAQLQTLVPTAKLVADVKGGRIVAWGTPADHESVKTALEKMVRGATPETTPRLEVYRLTKAEPTTLTPLLQTLVPDAKISVDPQTKTLIAVAAPADHVTIKTVLEQLQPEMPAPDAPQLRFYPLAQPQPATIVPVLQGLAPKAQVTLEPGGKRLTVVASPSDQAIVKAAIEQIQMVAVLDERPKLATYTVTPAQKKRFQSLATSLATELPGMHVVAESGPDELAVWAKPSQHVVIADILEQLKREVPAVERYELVSYPIKAADPKSVLTLMKTLFPNAEFVLDARTRRLIVWTLPDDQKAIHAALEKVDTGAAAEGQDKLMVYPVPDIDPATAIAMLQEQLPGAKLSTDPKSGSILAWARPGEHEILARMLKQMEAEPDAAHKPTVKAYPLPSGNAASLLPVLQTLVPKAQVAVEAKTNSILATALPKDHELIRAAVEQVAKQGPAGTMPEMVVHSVPSVGPGGAASILPTLRQIFPDATFAAGADTTRLVVWARPTEQEAIRKAVEELAKKEPVDSAHKLVIYTIDTSGPGNGSSMLNILRALFPDGSFGFGTDPSRLFVWARPDDHPAIKNTIDELAKKEPPETAHRLAVFTLDRHGPGGATGVLSVLRTMFPRILFSVGAEPDQLVAFVQPADEKRIQEALKTLAAPEDPTKARKMVVYTLESTGPGGVTGAISVLTLMFPEAKFSAGTEPQKLVAWARPTEHEKIQAAVEELAKEEPPETAHRLVIYTLETTGTAGMTGAVSILTTMFPEARFTPGSEPDKVAVWARPADHKKIEAAVKELSGKEPPEKAHQMVVYTLEAKGPAGAAGAIGILTTMFPEAKFVAGTEPGKVVAWARPPDQKRIAAAVAELSKKEPPETARKVVVYPFKSANASASYYTLAALRGMFPEAEFSIGADPEKLAVWARPADHEAIRSAVEQLSQEDPPETARRMVVYRLERVGGTGVSGAIGILTAMFPEATFSAGAEPDQVAALARPADHERIKSAVAELSKKEPPEKARKIVVYPFRSASNRTSYYTLNMLRAMFPDAEFSVGSDPGKVVVWARPADHEAIKSTVEQLSQDDPPERAYKLVTYTLESSGPTATRSAVGLLGEMFPEAQFTAGTEPGRLVAWARPDDQVKIKSAVEELSKQEPPEKAPLAAVYQLNSMSATAALPFLTTAFPEAQFTAGSEPHALIAWARPADQKQIKAAVEKIDVEGAMQLQRSVSIYSLKAGDSRTLLRLLEPMTRRNVEIVSDASRHRLVVWADPEQQEAVRKTVEQFQKENAKIGEPSTQVYRFQWADPQAAETVLSALVPAAQIALDTATHSLVATAEPEDHAKIKAAIDEMDRRDAGGQAPRLQVHRATTADPAHLLVVLRGLFRGRQDVQLSLDEQNDAIVAVASPAQHETIRNLIDQLEKEARTDAAVRLVLYPLKDADPDAVLQTLNLLFEKQGAKVRLSVEPRDNQLVAIARPEQHAAIEKALEQLRGEDRVFEILTLEVVDPWTAQVAIDRLFSDGLFPSAHAPSVDVDLATQQLFVRATKEQMTKIRELLVKLGETWLAGESGAGGRRSRTVPFDGDLTSALEEIQRVWPQLRKNPIQVVKPADAIPVQGRLPRRPLPDVKSQPIRPAAGPKGQEGKPLPRNEAKPTPVPAQRPASGGKATTPEEGWKPANDGWRASKAKGEESEATKPVVVVPGDGSVTIASDDPAALAQFEELLRALSRQRGVVGRNFTVFLLRNAKATELAPTLQRMFRTTPGIWRGGAGSVILVPDERLNAIVAYAGRADRATIESLVKILDTAEVPESLSADRLHLIRVENTSAAKIERTLRDLFKAHAEAFSVEETTNSIVVMASEAMVEEITRVITTLDEAAGGDPARKVAIIPLQKASAERVEKALNVILKSAPPRSRRRSGSARE